MTSRYILLFLGLFLLLSSSLADTKVQVDSNIRTSSLTADPLRHIDVELTFPEPELSITDGYTELRLEGTESSFTPGYPRLPVRYVNLFIPDGYRVASVKLLETEMVSLGRGYEIPTVQEPTTTGRGRPSRRNMTVYGSDRFFPSTPIVRPRRRVLMGYNTHRIEVMPVRYNPATGELLFHNKIVLRARIVPGKIRRKRQRKERQFIIDFVDNPEALALSSEAVVPTDTSGSDGGTPVDPFPAVSSMGVSTMESPSSGTCEYMIVYDPDLAGAATTLTDWKYKKGLVTCINSTTEINTTVTGSDLQEKIRKWIIDHYKKDGWVLLLGDYDVVPPRCLYDKADPEEDNPGLFCDDESTPSDLYYADLTVDWNGDNDEKYGEVSEDHLRDGEPIFDMVPEVYVGRIAAGSNDVAMKVVRKTIAYEKGSTAGDWMNKVLLLGAMLNFRDDKDCDGSPDHNTTFDGGKTSEDLKNGTEYFANGFTSTMLYEEEGHEKTSYDSTKPLTASNVLTEIENGHGFMSIIGHGSEQSISRLFWTEDKDGDGRCDFGDGCPPDQKEDSWSDFLNTSMSLNNVNKTPIVYATSCLTSLFDGSSDSLAEWMVNQEWSGAIGYVGGSRSLYYQSGNYDWYDSSLMKLFWKFLLTNDGNHTPGEALYLSKKDCYIQKGYYEQDYDKYVLRNYYSVNLLGDPETPIWTAQPTTITSTDLPSMFQTGHARTVDVDVSSSGVAVQEVRVCISGGGLHIVKTTDADGRASFSVNPTSDGEITLVVTKHNLLTVTKTSNALTDENAPTTTPSITSESWSATDRSLTLTCDDGAGGGCNGTYHCTDAAGTCEPGTTYGPAIGLSCGAGSVCTHYVRFRSRDVFDHMESTKTSVSIKIDKQKPNTTDNSNTLWHTSDQSISLSCTDGSGSGCDKTYYCTDTGTSCDPTTQYSGAISITCSADSTCTKYVRYYSKDKVANSEEAHVSNQVRIDKQKPTTTDSSDGAWHNTDRSITLSCSDNSGSGCNKTYYCLDTDHTCSPTTLFSGSVSVTCPQDNVCTSYVTYYSKDKVAHTESSHYSDAIKIDKQAPTTVPNVTQEGWYDNDQYLSLSCNDGSGSGCTSTDYCTDSTGQCSPETTYSTPLGLTCPDDDVRVHRVRFRSTDTAGNVEQVETSVSIRIDKQGPTTTSNVSTGWYSSDQYVSLSCSDGSGIGCNKTIYCLDESGSCAPDSTYTVPFQLSCASGNVCSKYVRYASNDTLYNTEATKQVLVQIDKAAPTTSPNVTQEAWYRDDQYLSLTCDDGAGGGCDHILYCIDETGSCQPEDTYTSPVLLDCADGALCSKYVRFLSNDTVGNIEAVKTSPAVKMDKRSPTTKANETRNGWYYENTTLTLSCDDDEGAGCNETIYCIDGSGACTPSTSYSTPVELTCLFRNTCTKYVRFRSNDTVGNLEDVRTSSAFWIDDSVIRTLSNMTHEGWYATNQSMALTCQDRGGNGCDTTLFCIDGEGTCTPLETYSSPVSVTCPQGSVCTRYVRYMSNDTVGGSESTKRSAALWLDMQAPTTTPNVTSERWYSEEQSLLLNCSDGNGIGCNSTTYCVDSNGSCIPNATYSAPINLDCSDGAVRTYFVRYHSNDTLNNTEGTMTSVAFHIDLQDPTSASNVSTAMTSNKDQYVSLNCTDGVGVGCNTTLFCTDASDSCDPDVTYDGPVHLHCDAGELCTWYVRFHSNDTVGNIEVNRTSGTITIDKKAPTTSSNVSSSLWYGTNVHIALTCDDSTGIGCDSTQYCIGGTSACTCSTNINYTTPIHVTCSEGSVCTHYVCYRSNDTYGHMEALRSTAVNIDRSGNIIYALHQPESGHYNNTSSIPLSFTVNERLADSCWYTIASIRDGTSRHTVTSCGNTTIDLSKGSWHDPFADSSHIDTIASENVTLSNGAIVLTGLVNGTDSSGSVRSVSIEALHLHQWGRFAARHIMNATKGISITYTLLDGVTNATKCTVDATGGSIDLDVSSCLSGATSVALTASLTSIGGTESPSVLEWNVTWKHTDGSFEFTFHANDTEGRGANITRNVTADTSPPTSLGLHVNDDASSTSSSSVVLTVSGGGFSECRFSNDGATWGAYDTYTTSTSWTLQGGAGAKTVYGQCRDEAGNEGSVFSDAITYSPYTGGGSGGSSSSSSSSSSSGGGGGGGGYGRASYNFTIVCNRGDLLEIAAGAKQSISCNVTTLESLIPFLDISIDPPEGIDVEPPSLILEEVPYWTYRDEERTLKDSHVGFRLFNLTISAERTCSKGHRKLAIKGSCISDEERVNVTNTTMQYIHIQPVEGCPVPDDGHCQRCPPRTAGCVNETCENAPNDCGPCQNIEPNVTAEPTNVTKPTPSPTPIPTSTPTPQPFAPSPTPLVNPESVPTPTPNPNVTEEQVKQNLNETGELVKDTENDLEHVDSVLENETKSGMLKELGMEMMTRQNKERLGELTHEFEVTVHENPEDIVEFDQRVRASKQRIDAYRDATPRDVRCIREVVYKPKIDRDILDKAVGAGSVRVKEVDDGGGLSSPAEAKGPRIIDEAVIEGDMDVFEVEYISGRVETKTLLKQNVTNSGSTMLGNVSVIVKVPKEIAQRASNLAFLEEPIVIEEDPVVGWMVDAIPPNTTVSRSIIVPREVEVQLVETVSTVVAEGLVLVGKDAALDYADYQSVISTGGSLDFFSNIIYLILLPFFLLPLVYIGMVVRDELRSRKEGS